MIQFSFRFPDSNNLNSVPATQTRAFDCKAERFFSTVIDEFSTFLGSGRCDLVCFQASGAP
jgi:hypothetical protein